MNLLHKILLACCFVLPLSACSQKTLPPWQGEALTVHFSARVVPQASELPMQGGLRMAQDGGTLGLILQHGRTLGQCRFVMQGNNLKPNASESPDELPSESPDELPRESPAELPNELPNELARELRLQCRAAEGVGAAGQNLLQRVALAVYHALPTLTIATPPTTPKALQRFVYEDSLGSVDIVFSEVRRP